MFAGEVHHLRHFGLGDLVGEYAALADPVVMRFYPAPRTRAAAPIA